MNLEIFNAMSFLEQFKYINQCDCPKIIIEKFVNNNHAFLELYHSNFYVELPSDEEIEAIRILSLLTE